MNMAFFVLVVTLSGHLQKPRNPAAATRVAVPRCPDLAMIHPGGMQQGDFPETLGHPGRPWSAKKKVPHKKHVWNIHIRSYRCTNIYIYTYNMYVIYIYNMYMFMYVYIYTYVIYTYTYTCWTPISVLVPYIVSCFF